MEKIVCATRGGEACRRTQEKAIALAKERDAELVFLYVVDPSLVGPVDESLTEAVNDEMTRLGRSLLHVAQGRADEQGQTSEAVIRHGKVQSAIQDYLRQVGASTLVLGCPRTDSPSQAFTSQEIQDFAETLRQDLGIEVVVVT
jgi:nucleotide-binding universal stress UspA family protein